jgi:hypothetical protein
MNFPSRRLFLLLACLNTLAGSSQAEPLRHLFLDPAFLQLSENVALRVNPPQAREIVIRPDRPWEQLMISFFCTVLEDGGKLRMWYICRDKKNQPNVAYAESTDGVTWVKPNLGIVEYEGSTENNLVGMDSLEGTVYRDERSPASERYCYLTHLITEGMVRFHSPDGLHWKRDAAPLVNFGADSQAVTFWDERAGKYALYLRGWEQRADKKLYRTVVRADLPSLTAPLAMQPSENSRRLWGKEKVAVIDTEFPKVLATDDADPPDSDVYTISAQTYPLDPRWYLGFPSFFQREKSRSDGRLDVEFIGSRDGVHWQRYDRAPYSAPGLAGTENANMTFIGPGLIVRGDEIWQYGVGLASRHGDKEARMRKTDGAIYRYVQRVDGFVALEFEAKGGRCTTAPVKVEGPQLLLNVDTGALGHLRVSLAEPDGTPISGFGIEEGTAIRTNSTHAVAVWKGQSDLAALQGREVRVVLSGTRARLFSFRFAQ